MINLLPPEQKQAYRYARRNTTLVRWLTGSLLALIGLLVISSYGFLAVRGELIQAQQDQSKLQAALEADKLTQTNAQVTEISNNLKLAEKVLSQQILFSELLKQLATALPPGSGLANLTIMDVTAGTGLDVTVGANDYTTATQVQVNLSDPDNKIFERADIQSITCNDGSDSDTESAYPCQITLRTQFAKDNPFLFVNQQESRQ